MSMHGAVDVVALVLAVACISGCERARPFDPEARGLEILANCGADSACVHEQWRRDPRDWNIGLRAEIAGRRPDAPLVVETAREITTPDAWQSTCLPGSATGAGLYYRTSVAHKGSAEFPFLVFHWRALDEAAAGHRRALAAVADARGDDERLWQAIEKDETLDRSCVRFRGKRDRCQFQPPVD
jgi:hypothetical protein